MYQVIIVIHVILGLAIVGLILMQQGKGADAGATFGGGASGSVFGAQGAASFLSRTTAILATLFFVTSLGLAFLNSHKSTDISDLMGSSAVEKDSPGSSLPAAGGALTDKPAPSPAENPVENKGVAPQAPAAVTDMPAPPAATIPSAPAEAADKSASPETLVTSAPPNSAVTAPAEQPKTDVPSVAEEQVQEVKKDPEVNKADNSAKAPEKKRK